MSVPSNLRNEKKQTAEERKIKIGAVVGFAVAALVGMTVATQFFAYKVHYWSGLSGEIIEHVYCPWQIFIWRKEHADQMELFQDPVKIAFSVWMLLNVLVFAMVMVAKNKILHGLQTLHGSARWADYDDVKRAGLIQENSKDDKDPYVYVGAYKDPKGRTVYLRHSGPEHILTYAPTRSGKGVGLVIPTLLSWHESAVITDLKGELWSLTAGFRHNNLKQKTIRFEPASATSARWNPISEVRYGTSHAVGDAQNLANMIVDPDGKGLEGADAHWKKTAFAMYTGLILFVLWKHNKEPKYPATIAEIDRLLSDASRDIKELWQEMIESGQPVVMAAAKDQLDRPDEEAGSVLSTVKSNLSLYRDQIVSDNTSASDFRIKDIMNCNQAVSVYVVTQPADKTRLKPLVRIFVNMVVRLLADKMKVQDGRMVRANKHRLLMMLDEFPSLGKLDVMQESLAFVAGYGIKCYLICQDLSQLKSNESGYGQEESITSNCHIQNAYPPNRMDTAKYLSELTGQTTIVKESITKSGSGFNTSTSRTMQEVQRPLLTPDECLRLPSPKKNDRGDIVEAGDMLIFVAGFPAIYGKQPLYFKDKVFLNRSKIAAPGKSDTIKEEDRCYRIDEDEEGESKEKAKEAIFTAFEEDADVNDSEVTVKTPKTEAPQKEIKQETELEEYDASRHMPDPAQSEEIRKAVFEPKSKILPETADELGDYKLTIEVDEDENEDKK